MADAVSISYDNSTKLIDISLRTDCPGITVSSGPDSLIFFYNFDIPLFPNKNIDEKQVAGDGEATIYFHDRPNVGLRWIFKLKKIFFFYQNEY